MPRSTTALTRLRTACQHGLLAGVLCFANWAMPGAAWAQQTSTQPLLTPQALAPLLDKPALRVIDIRDNASFAQGHIPGAVNAPYSHWRGPAHNPGLVPALEQLTALVQSLGLEAGSHAVIVSGGQDAADFGTSARVYWTLKSLGVQQLSIVNGGMQAWEEDFDLPLNTAADTAQPITPSHFAPQWQDQWLAGRAEVAAHLQTRSATLVDARPQSFYLGQTKAPDAKAAGTLPQALNADFQQWFTPGSGLMDTAQAQAKATELALPAEQATITFCNAGHWAAIDWFVLSELAQQPQVKMYAGSMVDWTQAPQALPMANEPSRSTQIARAAQQWWSQQGF